MSAHFQPFKIMSRVSKKKFKSLTCITNAEDLKRIRESRNDEIPLFEKINYELRACARNPSNPIEAFVHIEKYEEGELDSVKRKLEKYGFVVQEKQSIVNRNEPKFKYWLVITREDYDLQQRRDLESQENRVLISNKFASDRNLVGFQDRDYPPNFPTRR